MAQDVFGDIFARRGGGAAQANATGSPVSAPSGAGPGAAPVQTPGPAGSQDPLAQSLANVNSNLQAVASGQMEMTPEAQNEIKVTVSLLTSLAQAAQGQAQPTAPGGPALSQAGPGGSQPASAPSGAPTF